MTMQLRSVSSSVGRRQSSMVVAASFDSSDALTTGSASTGSYLDLRVIGTDSNDVVEQTASNPSRSLLPMFDQADGNSSCDDVFSPGVATNSKMIVRSSVDSLNITSSTSSDRANSLSEKHAPSVAESQLPTTTLLSGVCAFVEVESSGVSTVTNELRRMGATVLLRLTRSVTHFIFNNGRRKMLEKARKMTDLRIVNTLWVHRCFQLKRRVHESDYPATLDVTSDYDDDDVAPSPVLCASSKPGSKIKTRFMICRSVEEEMALSEKRLNDKKRREEQRKLAKEIAAYDPYTPVRLLNNEDADSSGGSMLGLRPLQSDSDMSSLANNSLVSSNDSVAIASVELNLRIQALKRQQPSKRVSRCHVEDTLLDTPLAERLKKRFGEHRRASSLVETAPAERRFQKKRPLSPVEMVRTPSPTPTDSSISMGPVPAVISVRRSRRHVAVNTSNDIKESSPSTKLRRVARRHTIANINLPQSPTQLLVTRVNQLNIDAPLPVTDGAAVVAANGNANDATVPKNQSKSPEKTCPNAEARQNSESPELCSPIVDRAKKGVKRRRMGKSEMYRLYSEAVDTPAGTPDDGAVRHTMNESRRRGRPSGVCAVKTTSKLLNQLQRGLPSSEEFVQKTRPRIHHRRLSSRRPRSNVVLTSLAKNERNTMLPIIKKLGRFDAALLVDDSTSHVVCKDQRRTLNLLKGVVRGCWIVSDEWVYRSLETGSWLPEEDFEMVDWAPAIKKRRMSADQPSTLFATVGSFYIAPDCNPSSTDLADLITHSGGKVVSMPRASVFILAHRTALTDRFLRDGTVKAVSEKWVLDSIMMDELQSLDSYAVP